MCVSDPTGRNVIARVLTLGMGSMSSKHPESGAIWTRAGDTWHAFQGAEEMENHRSRVKTLRYNILTFQVIPERNLALNLKMWVMTRSPTSLWEFVSTV